MATQRTASIYDFEATSIDGKPAHLATQRGKVLLIVNTASECGFTPQFAGLEKLWQDYRDQGLVVIGFPSNQFGAQDPGANDEIASFCQINYGVSFPMMGKVEVNGDDAHPLGSGSRPRRRACSAPSRSSGTSPSSWSAATARCSSATRRTTRPSRCARDIEAALAA